MGLAALGGGSAIVGGLVASTAIGAGSAIIQNRTTQNAIKDARQATQDGTNTAIGAIGQQYKDASDVQNEQFTANLADQDKALTEQRTLNQGSLDLQKTTYDDSVARQNAALAEQRGIYDGQISEMRQGAEKTAEAYRPYQETGQSGLNALAKAYGLDYVENGQSVKGTGQGNLSGFTASPDYEFRRDESLRGADASLAARGLMDSGAAQKARIKLAGNLASGEFSNWADRLAQIAGVGLSATNSATQAGLSYASNIANLSDKKAGAIGTNANNVGNLNSSFATNVGNLNSDLSDTVAANTNTKTDLRTGYADDQTAIGSSYATNLANLAVGQASNNANASIASAASNNNAVGAISGLAQGLITNVGGRAGAGRGLTTVQL